LPIALSQFDFLAIRAMKQDIPRLLFCNDARSKDITQNNNQTHKLTDALHDDERGVSQTLRASLHLRAMLLDLR
jgi:hypothetical protein